MSTFPFEENWSYSASTAIYGAKLRSTASFCKRLLPWLLISYDYRGVREMVVKVKCKLTSIEAAQYLYGHCVFLLRPFLSLNYSREKRKSKDQRKSTIVALESFCVLPVALFFSLGKSRH